MSPVRSILNVIAVIAAIILSPLILVVFIGIGVVLLDVIAMPFVLLSEWSDKRFAHHEAKRTNVIEGDSSSLRRSA